MTDHRFNELLNLYIDRQISPDEARELETELQADPRRRETYRQYCRMHHATKLVYESFRQHAAAHESATGDGHGSVADFAGRRDAKRTRWMYYAGALATAACLTVLVSRINFTRSTGAEFANLGTVTPKQTPQPAAPVAVAAARETRSDLVSLRQTLNAEPDYAAVLAALRQEERSLANGRLSNIRVQSLFDDGAFDSRQFLSNGDQRVFRKRNPQTQPPAEFTAFQFQR